MTKFASTGIRFRLFGEAGYPCKHDWPEDCKVQCGERGLVLAKPNPYYTDFFEAFPRDPDTFIRGEGETIEAAEQDCWNKYQQIVNCPGHEFEPRNRTDGVGWCKHCELFVTLAFPEMLKSCCVCGEATRYFRDTKNLWYCKAHYYDAPDENLEPMQREIRNYFKNGCKLPDE